MNLTHLVGVAREGAGDLWREVRILLTPVPRPKKWLFLVGCYNSGTTLLAELLSQHPSISGLPTEGHFITNQFIKDYEIGLPRMWSAREELFRLTEGDSGPDPIRIKKEWGMRLDRSKPVLLEKSPPNTPRTRWLQEHFEDAHFVSIVRNGYAVAEGIRRKADPRHLPASWPIEACARQWCRSIEVVEEDAPYLKNLLWISYEQLVASPHDVLNEVADFVGLPPFEKFNAHAELSIHERKESVQDLNQVSIDKLSKDDVQCINMVAEPLLKRYGYKIIDA